MSETTSELLNNLPRHLIQFDPGQLPKEHTDTLVIGTGIAGSRAALEASRSGSVTMITKESFRESNTNYAQGGIAAALNTGDSSALHAQDTIDAARGLGDEQLIHEVVQEGQQLVQELIDWGTNFDREEDNIQMTREGGHSRPRVLHAGGDQTGRELARILQIQVENESSIVVRPESFAIDLLTSKDGCEGVLYRDTNGELRILYSRVTILASGGSGQLYRETTNPPVATGDGAAMAFRAGATLEHMEFFQFHPTTLYIAGSGRKLVSEAVRGEGGKLINCDGERFMEDRHPDADLAPRDVVSRGIIREIAKTDDNSVYLDLRHLSPGFVESRFPGLYELCRSFELNVEQDPIPVHPSAHYQVGGVQTDETGRTAIDRLLAAGEVACTGFHGANRLGSNSLLEGLVFGHRTGQTAAEYASISSPLSPPSCRDTSKQSPPHPFDLEDLLNSIQSVNWKHSGIIRHQPGLEQALEQFTQWGTFLNDREFQHPQGWELQNLYTLSCIIGTQALKRRESRGCHFREDFPERNNGEFQRSMTIKR